MTYRGIFQNGVVIVENADGLRNGTVVDVQPAKRSTKSKRSVRPQRSAAVRSRPAKKTRRKGRARKAVGDPFIESFGLWKDRPEWKGKSTLEIAAELRRKAMGRFGG